MALTLTIDGVDKTSLLAANSLNITDTLNKRNSASLTLNVTAGGYRPAVGDPITITDGATDCFAGTIDDLLEERFDESTDGYQIDVEMVDKNQILDRHLVARAYENETLADIVQDIVDNDLTDEGLTTTNVQTGPTIEKAVFNYLTVAEAFNELANITGYAWYVDYDGDLHFFSRETSPATVSFDSTSYNFRKLRVRRSRDQYRNRQYIRGSTELTDARTNSFVGDGTRQTFNLEYPVGLEPTAVTVNAVSKTIGIRGIDTGKDWYYQLGETEISQDTGGLALTSGQTLAVTYQGQIPLLLQSERAGAVAERLAVEGGSGIYEAIEVDESINSSTLAQQKADGLLRRFGYIPKIGELETDAEVEPDAYTLRAGQLVSFDIPAHDFTGDFLVESIKISDVDGLYLKYEIKCLDGEALGGWADFFAALAAAGKRFVIRENEVLVVARMAADVLSFTDSLATASGAPDDEVDSAEVDYGEVV